MYSDSSQIINYTKEKKKTQIQRTLYKIKKRTFDTPTT